MKTKGKFFKLATMMAGWIIFITGAAYAAPDIISVSAKPQILCGDENTATLQVAVSSETGVTRVWADIYAPEVPDPVATPDLLETDEPGIYEYVYEDFTAEGDYDIIFKAKDTQEDIADAQISVTVTRLTDRYEEDDAMAQANVIILNAETLRWHNFDKAGDEDWVKFYGLAGEIYEIKAGSLGSACDIIIECYDAEGQKLTETEAVEEENLKQNRYKTETEGIHYVRFYNGNENVFGADTGYAPEIKVFLKDAPAAAPFRGTVVNTFSNAPLGDVMIKTSGSSYSALSDEEDEGGYVMYHPFSANFSSPYMLTARFAGYEVFERGVFMTGTDENPLFMVEDEETEPEDDPSERKDSLRPSADKLTEWDGIIRLVPKPRDINGDGKADLADALIALQVIAGMNTDDKIQSGYVMSDGDVNGDGKIGMTEVIRLLQSQAGS